LRAPACERLRRALFPVLFGSPLQWKDPLFGGIFWPLLTWDTLVWKQRCLG